MRGIGKIAGSMPLLPATAIATQYGSSPGSLFGHTDVIAQGVETEHQYVMRAHNSIHIYIRFPVLLTGWQFIYFH